jgi:hypothetical protein
MSKHGETERFIVKLFEDSKEFVFDGEKLKILKIGKPSPARGECKTDVYILAINENLEEKEIKISIKQSDADFLENKMSLERAIEIFGIEAKSILIESIKSVEDTFSKDFLVYFKKHIRTEEKCIKIGWKFELINKSGVNRSGKIELTREQKINVYAGSNLSKEKKDSKVKGEVIIDSGVANYILEVENCNNNLSYYINNLLPIEEYAEKQNIYFACKAINYRAQKDKWDGNRPLSVYIDWRLEDGVVKADFVMDKPLEIKADKIGFNIRKILQELNIDVNNFDQLENFLELNIVTKK